MTRNTWLGVIALVIVVVGGWYAYSNRAPDSGVVSSNAEESAVRGAVVEFGTKLQLVSLLAPAAERKAAMDSVYGPYVAPELLAQWYPEGAEGALGRYTSSPWPEKIDIVSVEQIGEGAVYRVEGNIIEVVSGQDATKKAAAVQPVTLMVEKRDGAWLITESEKGSYSQLPHQQTIIGFWECLPHKDTTGPQTMECAFGIAVDQSDGHFAIDTRLMSTYPVDYPVGTKVRVTGIVTPANQLSSPQKYDIDGIISATTIERL